MTRTPKPASLSSYHTVALPLGLGRPSTARLVTLIRFLSASLGSFEFGMAHLVCWTACGRLRTTRVATRNPRCIGVFDALDGLDGFLRIRSTLVCRLATDRRPNGRAHTVHAAGLQS